MDAKFLLSRQALFDHLEETEKILTQKVAAWKPKDPIYQEELIEKYLTLQDDLAQLKQVVLKGEEQWDNKTITAELRQLLDNFNNFLKNTGFIPT